LQRRRRQQQHQYHQQWRWRLQQQQRKQDHLCAISEQRSTVPAAAERFRKRRAATLQRMQRHQAIGCTAVARAGCRLLTALLTGKRKKGKSITRQTDARGETFD
jgi:hypothetical protein